MKLTVITDGAFKGTDAPSGGATIEDKVKIDKSPKWIISKINIITNR